MDDMSITAVTARIQQIMSLGEQMTGTSAPAATPAIAPTTATSPTASTTAFASQLAMAQQSRAVDGTISAASMDGTTLHATTPSLATMLPQVVSTPAVAAAGSDPQLAARLDAWMASRTPNSPLVGLGSDFVAAGRANGIDPRLLVAIASQESALGTAGSGANINNAFGWGPAIPFASWSEGINRVAQGLASGYVGQGRDTIATIQQKWAPVGAANDPGGLNSNWTAGVSRIYAELGGDPNASVRISA